MCILGMSMNNCASVTITYLRIKKKLLQVGKFTNMQSANSEEWLSISMNICVSIYVCMYVHWYTYTEVNKSPLKGIKTCHSKICHFKGVLGGLVDSRLSLPCPRFNPWSGNWDPTSNMVWPKQKQNMSFWHKKCFKQKEFENWYVQEELSDLPPFPWSRPGDPHVRVPSRRVTSCPSCTPGQISIFVSEEEKSKVSPVYYPQLIPFYTITFSNFPLTLHQT